jgi:hypothetical protein
MNPEEVARKYQFRESMDLVDYAEVGLPIFRLTVEAITMAQNVTPTIQEFVLRSIQIGEDTVDGVAGFLGLELDIVDAVVRELRKDGLIATADVGPNGEVRQGLTDIGTKALSEACRYEPQEEMLVIDYDGIRRKPVWLGNESVLRASDLAASGAVQVRPYPAVPPRIDELSIPEVTRVVRRQAGPEFPRDVLTLKRVVRRYNVFREAIGLVYRNKKTKEVQIGFVVADRPAEDYELEFARHGGPKKMGLVRGIEEADNWARIRRRLGTQLYQLLPDEVTLAKRRSDVAVARESVRVHAAKVEGTVGSDRLRAREEFIFARDQLLVAEHALDALKLRPLAPYEQRELLEEAITEAQNEILVSSSGLDPYVVTGYFLRAIDQAIERGVRITVESTFNPIEPLKKQKAAYDPLAELVARHKQQSGFKLKKGRHEESLFYLFKDEDLGVLSNTPFLGERRRRTNFLCISGVVSSHPDVVSAIRQLLRID